MDNTDLYLTARQIALNLRDEGEVEWATKLEDAIAFGSTSTEILMAIRWHLQQLEDNRVKCSTTTKALVISLLQRLESFLQ